MKTSLMCCHFYLLVEMRVLLFPRFVEILQNNFSAGNVPDCLLDAN